MANLIKTAQFEELIEGRQLDCASARRSAGIRSSLRDAGEAEEYLNAALEEGNPELFLLALRNVAEAQGGVAQLAEKAKLNRESLYKILSERGNPELKSLNALLHALGFRLALTATR
jgi:probable addiction module antidote protein